MFEGLRFFHWQTEIDADGIVILSIDRAGSPVNTFARAVLDEFSEILERLAIEPPKGLVIHSTKAAGFVAGADIREFAQYEKAGAVLDAIEYGQRVFERLARLGCPTVVAIHGHCMGGGTEMSLACRYRVASRDPSTRIGLPEVKLGIHPGWGGTARLPYLIGAPKALDVMLTGRTLSAESAKAIGFVDKITSPELLIETAKELIRQRPARPLSQRLIAWSTNTWLARQILAPMVRKQTEAKARPDQYPAPFATIEVWRRGGSIDQRLKNEARSVAKLAQTLTARNLIRVFFLQEQLKGLGSSVAHGIEHVHVVGAGVMGGDIAAWCALSGFQVTLQDREMKYIEPAIQRAKTLYTKKLKTPERVGSTLNRLKADVNGAGISKADLLIEAIFENLEAKQTLYRQIEAQFHENELLATNTSSIPLDALRTVVIRPEFFLGLHFFNPVAAMPLVEVVTHDQTSPATIKRALAFCRAINKLPVPVKSSPGFLVNRILMPYLLEAMTLYGEGVPGPVLDKAAKRWGMPMGPIELADTIGLDVAASVGKMLAPFLGLDIPIGLDSLLQSGKRGKKDGQGFYVWQEGKPLKPEIDPNYAPPADLTERMILPLLNESVACLHEGVVDSVDLLDAGVIFGTGYAPFRGGPIATIRTEGASEVKARLEAFAIKYGKRFAPKPGWDSPTLS